MRAGGAAPRGLLRVLTERAPGARRRKGGAGAERGRRRGAAGARGREGRRRRAWLLVVVKLAVACGLLYGAVGVVYYLMALRYDLSELHRMPERTVVYDANGEIIGRYSGENRVVIPYSEIPETFIKALLAREDSRFYRHLGVDPIGIARAAVRNLLAGGIRQGGSTITQQLARNSFPLGGRNYHRKLLEAALSFRIETELSKEEILESYVNRIYFGSGCYGLQTASLTYFDKPARDLSLSEAALLAGLIRSPTRLSPFNDPDAALRARDSVLARLLELGWIAPDEAAAAAAEPLRLSPKPPVSTADGWAMDSIRRELEPILDRLGLEEAGLNIYSTLDLHLQATAEATLARHLTDLESRPNFHPRTPSDPLQGAVFILDHRNGAVRAVVGGRDFASSKFNRAYFARRQAGSVVKPFILAQALASGLSPSDRISDARLSPAEIPRRYGPYNPANADGRYSGPRPIEDIVIYSRNTMTVRAGLRAGLDNVIRLLHRAGIADNLPNYPSILLGAFETNLRALVSATTAFPNHGNQVHPFLIAKITDIHGNLLYSARQIRTPLLEPHAAAFVRSAMLEVLTRGTGAAAPRLGHRLPNSGGKTGTTNNFQDAWFVGFAGNLTAGVWVGFDRPQPIAPNATGASTALPIWVEILNSPAAAPYVQ